ncbi:MAG: ABC transporter ATP-binding protein [Desulfurococcaceae archaeon]
MEPREVLNIFELRNVSKYYGYGLLGLSKFAAVDNVDFSITNNPAIYVLAGESGCGKTTLAKMLLRIVKPDNGRILFLGKDLWKLKGNELKEYYKMVQPVFQDPYDTFNPYENLEIPLIKTAQKLLEIDRERAVEIVAKALEIVGLDLDTIRGRKRSELSGGQLQRVSIARSLVVKPRLLIADEPVSMLDASLRANILNIFKRLKEQEKMTILYITHDLATAYYIGDHISIMFRGCIIEHGNIDEVLKNPLHPYTITLLESLPDYSKKDKFLRERVELKETELQEFLIKGCKYYYRCPSPSEKCYETRPAFIEARPGHFVACMKYTR